MSLLREEKIPTATFSTVNDRPPATHYGVGKCRLLDTGVIYESDGYSWTPLEENELTWANKPSASDYGVGSVWFSDIGAMGYSDGVSWSHSKALKNLTNEILVKYVGLNVSAGALLNTTNFNKIVAPGDFDAVRVVVYHHEATTPTFKAIVAATETIETDTDSERYHPIVGGVEYKTLNAANGKGWFDVTWSGAASVSGTAGTATTPSTVISDWIPISSVPRADGSLFPALMTRLNITTATASYKLTNTAMRTPTTANGGFIYQNGSTSDAGGAFLSTVTTDTSAIPTGTNTPLIAIQFRTRKAGISLMCIGDSITQNNTVIPDTMSSWGLRAAAAISALGIPCGNANHGSSSRTATEYSVPGLTAISAFKPNVVMIPGLSPNGPGAAVSTDDGINDTLRLQAAIVSNLEAAALAVRATPIVWAPVPSSSTIASSDAIRKAYGSSVLTTKANALDFFSVFDNGANPSRIKAEYAYDTTHPNEAGVAVQADLLVTKLKGLYAI